MKQSSELEPRGLVPFFIITFAWSWLFWLPSVMSPTGYSEPLHYALFFIGAFGPFVGAFSLTYLNEEKEGVKKTME